ncbi:MAG TPA: ABC transporter substrate-binding protein [Burkholderiales bacterium]|nr:ABC transporter substrate-binding protein [Burkholderiales bacterium]
MIRSSQALAVASLLACLGAFGCAGAADAQQPAAPRRIGVLLVGPSLESKEAQAFRQGLRDAGYVEGRDVAIEWRSADGDYARVPELAADLVQRKVDVIVSDGTVGTRAAKRATSAIPIVMSLVSDPVGSGLVASLAHPGGNVTGLTIMTTELSAKLLQLLKEAIPRLTRGQSSGIQARRTIRKRSRTSRRQRPRWRSS